jgi:PBP1b-binding outer membrane lipoprotein LpoB
MKKIYYFLLLPVCLFLSCEAEEVQKEILQEKELLEITDLEVPETGGFKIEATYTGAANFSNLKTGFLVSTHQIPNTLNAREIPGITSGNRTLGESGSDFIYNVEYYVRAYLVYPEGKIL